MEDEAKEEQKTECEEIKMDENNEEKALNETAEAELAGQEHETAEAKPDLHDDDERDLESSKPRPLILKKIQKTSLKMKPLKMPSTSSHTTAEKKIQNLQKLKNKASNEEMELNENTESKPASREHDTAEVKEVKPSLQEDEQKHLEPPNQRLSS